MHLCITCLRVRGIEILPITVRKSVLRWSLYRNARTADHSGNPVLSALVKEQVMFSFSLQSRTRLSMEFKGTAVGDLKQLTAVIIVG